MSKKYSLSNDYELIPANLQLFAGDDPDDVDYSDDDPDDETLDEGEEEDNTDDENDDAHEHDTPEDSDDKDDKEGERVPKGKPDKRFEAMREKAEKAARKKFEAEKAQLDSEKANLRAREMQLAEAAIESKAFASITPDRIWAKADEEGISESAARKLLESEMRIFVESEKQKIRGHFQQRESQKAQLRKEEFFSALESDIDAICDANPSLPVKLVYDQLVGQRYRELTQAKNKQSEKGAIANEQDRMRRRNVSGTSKSSYKSASQLSSFGREAAIAMGLDPREVAKHNAKRRGNFRV